MSDTRAMPGGNGYSIAQRWAARTSYHRESQRFILLQDDLWGSPITCREMRYMPTPIVEDNRERNTLIGVSASTPERFWPITDLESLR